MAKQLLSVKDLQIRYESGRGSVAAVRGVSFDVQEGEVFALVGESGCGKSTTAEAMLRLVRKPGVIAGGEIHFEDTDLLKLSEDKMAKVRGQDISMIFQNPLVALNPVYRAGTQVEEGLLVGKIPKEEAWQRALEVLGQVKIPDVADRAKSFPHELSGGMRQRVMIGMMIARTPKLLIADEPTTALDVTIQAQILELLMELRRKNNMSILIITHDFGVVADIADRVAVMYAGNIVEQGDVFKIFEQPLHPYTRLLMRALPKGTKHDGPLETIKGSVPNLVDMPPGCPFAPRCPERKEICEQLLPEMRQISPGHQVSCHSGGE